MLKAESIDFLRKEWQDEEDFAFMCDMCEMIVHNYKKAIKDGQFISSSNEMVNDVNLWASVHEWLKNLNNKISFNSDKKQSKKIYDDFLYILSQEILIPNITKK